MSVSRPSDRTKPLASDLARPPCWPAGQPQPNACAGQLYQRIVHGHQDFSGDWYGWKMRGRWLVSPEGDRISPERMKGLLWRLQAEERLTAAKARNAQKPVRHSSAKVVVVDLADWHAKHFGTMAG